MVFDNTLTAPVTKRNGPISPDTLALTPSQMGFLWCFLGALFVVRLVAMVLVPFTDTTEARYAEIARKMLETGDWITPQFQYGVPFWGKPPLHTWLSAAGMGAFGVNEFAARLPIFAVACALLMLVYYWARAEKGKGFALVSTAILASSGMFFIASAVVMTDLVLIFGTTLSMVAFWNAIQLRARARLWGYLFFVGLAVGLLAKGPLAVVLTGLPVGLWVLTDNRWKDTWHRIPWFSGTLLMLIIAAPWYLAAEFKTPGFLRYFIVGEHFERFTVPGWKGDLYGSGHRQPRGMIWLFGLLAFLPWSLFFLRPILRFRTIAEKFRGDDGGWGRYQLFWTLSPLIFFTAAGNTLAPYALPALPSAAILLVLCWIDDSSSGAPVSNRSIQVFKGLALGLTAIMAVALIILAFAPGLISTKSQKTLVAETTRLAPSDGGDLVYWKERYYSAEFYTRGKARRIDSGGALARLITDARRDFLAIRPRDIGDIPANVMDRFSPIGQFGKVMLFLEKPLTNSPATSLQGSLS